MGYLESLMGRHEGIVFKTRKHWLVILPTMLINSSLSLLIMVGSVLLVSRRGPLALLAFLLLVFPLGKLALDLLHWWNEQYVITNRRVVQVEGIINKHVIDSSLEKVNDVVLDQSFFGRFLGYGDVEILTASEIGVNRLDRVARPVRFKTEMLNQKEGMSRLESFRSKAKEVLSGEGPEAADIPRLISELDELRQKGVITEEEFQKEKGELLEKL
ncbi:MAG: PH domain-containing protein [Anaerolineae bacterium]